MTVDGETMNVVCFAAGDSHVDLAIDGRRLTFTVEPVGLTWLVQSSLGGLELEEQPRYPLPGLSDLSGGQVAPMPGAVLATEVSTGDQVKKGDLLLILEAMKMEHRITSPMDGKVEAIHVAAGDQVENGQLLVTINENE